MPYLTASQLAALLDDKAAWSARSLTQANLEALEAASPAPAGTLVTNSNAASVLGTVFEPLIVAQTVAPLTDATAEASYDQTEIQALMTKVQAIITALTTLGIFKAS